MQIQISISKPSQKLVCPKSWSDSTFGVVDLGGLQYNIIMLKYYALSSYSLYILATSTILIAIYGFNLNEHERHIWFLMFLLLMICTRCFFFEVALFDLECLHDTYKNCLLWGGEICPNINYICCINCNALLSNNTRRILLPICLCSW